MKKLICFMPVLMLLSVGLYAQPPVRLFPANQKNTYNLTISSYASTTLAANGARVKIAIIPEDYDIRITSFPNTNVNVGRMIKANTEYRDDTHCYNGAYYFLSTGAASVPVSVDESVMTIY